MHILYLQDKKETLLIKAARQGKEDILQLLLNAGAAIEATNKVTISNYVFAMKLLFKSILLGRNNRCKVHKFIIIFLTLRLYHTLYTYRYVVYA
jgi:ankyrin repeat protein